MKYLWSWIAGCVLGAIAGVAVLIVNPLTRSDGGEVPAPDLVYRHALPDSYALFTHGSDLPASRLPPEVDELWEKSVARSAIAVLGLSDEHGAPAAIASRLAWPSKRTEMLSRGVIADDAWLLTTPGQGSLFVIAESNVWPALADTLVRTRLLGRDFDGPREYRTTRGPANLRTARVRGATLAFAGVTGVAAEHWRIETFDAARGLEGVSGELRIDLDLPVDEAAPASDADAPTTVTDTGAEPAPAAARASAP